MIFLRGGKSQNVNQFFRKFLVPAHSPWPKLANGQGDNFGQHPNFRAIGQNAKFGGVAPLC